MQVMCSRKGWFLSNEEIVGTASMMNLTHTNLLQVTLQTFFFSVLINDNRSTNCVSKLLLLNSMGYHHRLPLLLEMRDGEAICFFFCLLLPAYVQPREPLFAGWIYFSLSLCGPVHCSKRETGGVFFPFFFCYPPSLVETQHRRNLFLTYYFKFSPSLSRNARRRFLFFPTYFLSSCFGKL